MESNRDAASSTAELPAFDLETEELNAIVDTPKGSRNKYAYDERRKLYRLSSVLPAGAVFPFDFGFVPSTLGGDGDPLDVLILMDEATFTGCLVPSRLVGVLVADQKEKGGDKERNDRLIAVAIASHAFRNVTELDQVSQNLVAEIEHFFVSYNAIKGKQFDVRGRFGIDRARKIVDEGVKRFRESHGESVASKTIQPRHAHAAQHPKPVHPTQEASAREPRPRAKAADSHHSHGGSHGGFGARK